MREVAGGGGWREWTSDSEAEEETQVFIASHTLRGLHQKDGRLCQCACIRAGTYPLIAPCQCQIHRRHIFTERPLRHSLTHSNLPHSKNPDRRIPADRSSLGIAYRVAVHSLFFTQSLSSYIQYSSASVLSLFYSSFSHFIFHFSQYIHTYIHTLIHSSFPHPSIRPTSFLFACMRRVCGLS